MILATPGQSDPIKLISADHLAICIHVSCPVICRADVLHKPKPTMLKIVRELGQIKTKRPMLPCALKCLVQVVCAFEHARHIKHVFVDISE